MVSGYQFLSTAGSVTYSGTGTETGSGTTYGACVATFQYTAPSSGGFLPYTGGQVSQLARRKRSQQALGATPVVQGTGSFALAPLAFGGTDLEIPPQVQPYIGGQAYRRKQQKKRQQALGPLPPPSGSFGLGALAFSGTVSVSPAAAGGFKLGALGFSGTAKETEPDTGGFGLGALAFSGSVLVDFPFPKFVLGLKYELLLNGTWTDITNYVYQRNPQVITRGLPDETASMQASGLTFTINNRGGNFTTGNSAGIFYPYITRNVQIRVSITDQVASATGVPYAGYRFWGEVSEWPPSWDPTGSDVYVQVVAAGVLRRYVQGAKIGSALRRYYANLTDDRQPYGLWPAEDATGSSVIASMLSSVEPMSFTGSPDFASDTAFGGSDAIPVVNSSAWHGETGADADPPGTGSIAQVNPGTYYWTCPPGVTSVDVTEAVGAGGGGGDTDGTTGGGGAGGAEEAADSSVGVTAGTQYTYVVPAGGAAGSGGAGTAGGSATFTGDTVTVTAHGGSGGSYAGAGSTGGTGSSNPTHHNGGAGASGEESSTGYYSDYLAGYAGSTGGGETGAQQSTDWTVPAGISGDISISAYGGGGGGGAGAAGAGTGGGGGGGGAGYSNGSTTASAGDSLTFYAGNGGGGNGSSGSGDPGGDGGDSEVSDGSVTAGGGGGAVNGSSRAGGSGGSGSTADGGAGGSGSAASGYMGAGGGGGGCGAFGGADGNSASGDSGGAGGGASGGAGGDGATSNGGPGSTGGGGGASGGGGGGGGTFGTDAGFSGAGGGGGYIQWSWEIDGAPAGGGGGSSAGTAAAGGAASGSTGGTAPTNGGAGGNQGANGSGPGGGGGGAYPAFGGADGAAAGNGAPGKIAFNWDGGVTSPVAADIVRCLLDVPAAGETDGTVLFQFVTYSDDVTTVNLVYHSGGNLELIGYNSSDSMVFDSGSKSFGADGTPMMVDIQLISDGADVEWSLSAIEPGAGSAIATYTGTVTGTVLYVSDVYVSPNSDVADSAVGWISVQTYADPLTTLAQVIGGYEGETGAARLSRLAVEEGITFTLIGSASDTPQMGPQQDDTLVNVFQSVVDFDRGQLFEPRDSLGIAYRTRVNMQNQNPAVILDYSAAELAQPIQPTADDQYTRNDITLTRQGGSSATGQQTTGTMSIYSPPAGVGDYTYSLTVYAYEDSQLANAIAWMLMVGTVDELRYPQLTIDLARLEVANLFAAVAGLDVGDFVQVTRPPTFLTSTNINQLCWGFTETLNAYVWTISINAVPEDPYSGADLPTW